LNWQVQMMPLKFLDDMGFGSSADAVGAIIYAADMGVQVLSNSWGGSGFSEALKDAVQYAMDHDILFVAAAGNNGEDTDVTPEYPACYDVDNVISVAASDHNDARALWGSGGGGDNCGIVCSSAYAALPGSNYGATTVDLAAPGKEIYSTIPGDQYANMTGTSMSTPFVAGAAALLMSNKTGLSVMDIKNRILSTADKLSSFDGITVSGGRLNVAALLETDK
ncbi:S8 family serine peptidase, partial [candidate division KSB1 bacterium]|nr:S8 family serine peptidase [candidate division KSB1 bacterium]